MQLADGADFAGYRIIRLLGSGGMGEVYLAQHPRLPRRDALKVLPAAVSSDSEFRQRFNREADIASSLWHPHIVGIHDRGEVDGQLWIGMDYVEGTDAARLVRDQYPGGMPARDVVEIVQAVAGALDYAHQEHLLHRDVKPANILMTQPRSGQRRVLLADFGIARQINEISGLTATNATVGSVSYAAPEQLTGETIDGRADQYALACTAFHLLTGAPPFPATNPAVVIGQHLSAPPPRISQIRPDLAGLDGVFATAMAKEPGSRFASCSDFANALANGGAQVPYEAPAAHAAPTMLGVPVSQHGPPSGPAGPPPQPGPAGHPPRGARTLRWPLVAAGVVLVLVVVAAVAFVGARMAQPDDTASSSTRSPRTSSLTVQPRTTRPSLATSTSTSEDLPTPATTVPPVPAAIFGDLGLAVPMSRPSCDGSGIVVLASMTDPSQYASEVSRQLAANPGASYLRTDQTCPSLRQAMPTGEAIYAVYRPAGRTQADVCAAVRSSGSGAYGKWLDTTTDPSYIIPC